MAPTSESAAGRCLFVLLGLQIVRAGSIQQQATVKHPLVVLMLDGYVFFFGVTLPFESCAKSGPEY